MKNDQTYVVNGQEAIFNATVIKSVGFLFPAAVFTFKSGEKIIIIHNTISGEQYEKTGKPYDFKLYYDGVWKHGN